MNITRHNYEEFFILYWDNELPADQKQQVELFVSRHPDLEEEFRLLGDTRFTPEPNTTFNFKEDLMTEPGSSVNEINYTNYLISYFDGELTGGQKHVFENYIAENPAVRKELQLLEKTRNHPDPGITFPGKSGLYRNEPVVRKIYFNWYRVAAAAVLVLLAGTITIKLLQPNTEQAGPESIATISQPAVPVQEKQAESPDLQNHQNDAIAGSVPEHTPDNSSAILANVKKSSANKKNLNGLPQRSEQPDLIASNTLTAAEENSTTIEKISNRTLSVIEPEKIYAGFDEMDVTERNSPAFNKQFSNSDILFASQKESDEDSGGLKGLLRKATRVFERHTKIQTTTDDNKLLIGAFAVSLK